MAMIRPVPLDEACDPLANRRRRPETDVAHQIVDVGVSCRHIAGLHGQQLAFGFFPDRFLKQAHHFEQLDWLVVANIIKTHGTLLDAGSGDAVENVGFPVGGRSTSRTTDSTTSSM